MTDSASSLNSVNLQRSKYRVVVKPEKLNITSRSSTPTNDKFGDAEEREMDSESVGSSEKGWTIRHPSRSGDNTSLQASGTDCSVSSKMESDMYTEQLENNQVQRMNEFLAGKKCIEELRPDAFEKISQLGAGSWGVVSRVSHLPTGLIMAKKSIRLDLNSQAQNQIMRELMILHECTSPFIIGYYGAYPSEGTIDIYMEYMDGGSVDMVLKRAGRMPEPIISRILFSVLKGLVYLRKNLNIIHRDVKPSNILMRRNGEIKLCDFGASGLLIDSVSNSFVGSRNYMAPERITGKSYNTSSDVWSLGLSLIELATGRFPIPAIEDEIQYFTVFSQDRNENLKEHLNAAREGRKLCALVTNPGDPMSVIDHLVYVVSQPLPRLPKCCFSDNFIDLVASCLFIENTERTSLDELLLSPFILTVAGACPAGANRCSSIRFSTYDPSNHVDIKNSDFDMADIAFYVKQILLMSPETG